MRTAIKTTALSEVKMNRDEFIKRLEELDRLLLEEVETDELTDYTREQAHYKLEGLIYIIMENEE